MTDKLSLCPFCGGKPEFRRSGRQGHYIACTGCDASSNMFTALKDDVRDLLIETWNRRLHPPKPEATEGGAHEKGIEAAAKALRRKLALHYSVANETAIEIIDAYRAALTPSPVLGNEEEGSDAV